ncbi:alpha/beta hydrolase [Nonomuraea sp. NPDC050536]|uniref:alpha/beta hydrolase n=1 Tax=Nonomuraea sp. NPDC050536 TaxID=3364366 RepID=UPI0037CA7FF2
MRDEGWGHRIYGKDECSTKHFDDYLISLTVPAPGTRCSVGGPEATLKKLQPQPWPSSQLHWAAMPGVRYGIAINLG